MLFCVGKVTTYFFLKETIGTYSFIKTGANFVLLSRYFKAYGSKCMIFDL